MNQTPFDLSQPFYRTFPLPCPYMEGRMERRVFTTLEGPNSHLLLDVLSKAGFRRSHDTLYRPACAGCDACIPVRIRVNDFTPNRSFRRILKRNEDLEASFSPAQATREQYDLFHQYITSRHGDGEMAHMTWKDYVDLIEQTPVNTMVAEYREKKSGRLIAACLNDSLSDGISAVYSFFDAGQEKRSLGTYIILTLIETARRESLPYLYLGYWIKECAKMSYKTRFAPAEILMPGGWQDYEKTSEAGK